MFQRYERIFTAGVSLLVTLGGLVLLLLIALTCTSVVGRTFTSAGLGPVPGDVELVELGIAAVVCACLPWVQLSRGHASVDLLKGLYGERFNHFLDLLWDLVMMLVAILLMRQMWLGMLDKKNYMETTFILQIPLWWAYLLAGFGLGVFALTALHTVIVDIRRLLGKGTSINIPKERDGV